MAYPVSRHLYVYGRSSASFVTKFGDQGRCLLYGITFPQFRVKVNWGHLSKLLILKNSGVPDLPRSVTVSVVSHGHARMLPELLAKLLKVPEVIEIILTSNSGEALDGLIVSSKVKLVKNIRPKGFAANHNSAFNQSVGSYFCPLNPDVSWERNPFPELLDQLEVCNSAIVAPLVLDPTGRLEDSARRFPSLRSLVNKALNGDRGAYEILPGDPVMSVDWVAGMFLLTARATFSRLGGFDESYRLYYEDVDLCARAWHVGFPVMVVPSVVVTHDARRASRRRPVYFAYHVMSLVRYLSRHAGRLPRAAPG